MQTIFSEGKKEEEISVNNNAANRNDMKEKILNVSDDILDPDISPEKIIDQNFKFYLEFCKLYEANLTLNSHLNKLLQEKGNLKREIAKIESRDKNIVIEDSYTNRKRHRRTKTEIQRNFKCGFPGCNKNYGSEGSLNQHSKLKHPNLQPNQL